MIEITLYNFLKSELTDPVYMEMPKTIPTKFYILEKTGSDMANHIASSTFALQSYAGSMYEAALMNETAKYLLLSDAFLELPDIGSIEWNSDYNFTDEERKNYRYQAVFDVTHY